MAETLQEKVDKIPKAVAGEPITVDLHNTLREVLILLASQGVGGPVTGPRASHAAPNFLEFGGGPNWRNVGGFASVGPPDAVGNRGAEGWVPVSLPDDARIDSMTVRGRRAGEVSLFQVRLLRASLGVQDPIALIQIDDLAGASDPFEETRSVQPAFASLAVVDNSKHTYFVTAAATEVGAALDADIVQIHSIQINYTFGAE